MSAPSTSQVTRATNPQGKWRPWEDRETMDGAQFQQSQSSLAPFSPTVNGPPLESTKFALPEIVTRDPTPRALPSHEKRNVVDLTLDDSDHSDLAGDTSQDGCRNTDYSDEENSHPHDNLQQESHSGLHCKGPASKIWIWRSENDSKIEKIKFRDSRLPRQDCVVYPSSTFATSRVRTARALLCEEAAVFDGRTGLKLYTEDVDCICSLLLQGILLKTALRKENRPYHKKGARQTREFRELAEEGDLQLRAFYTRIELRRKVGTTPNPTEGITTVSLSKLLAPLNRPPKSNSLKSVAFENNPFGEVVHAFNNVEEQPGARTTPFQPSHLQVSSARNELPESAPSSKTKRTRGFTAGLPSPESTPAKKRKLTTSSENSLDPAILQIAANIPKFFLGNSKISLAYR